MKYRIYFANIDLETPNAATTVDSIPGWSFIFDVNEPRYQQFKADIESGVELQDADGNLMSADQITDFLATLP